MAGSGKEADKVTKVKKRNREETSKPKVKKFKHSAEPEKVKSTKINKERKPKPEKQGNEETKSRKRKFTDKNKKLHSSAKKHHVGKSIKQEEGDKPGLWQMKKKERKTLRKKQSDSYDLVFEMMQIYEKVRRKHCSKEEREKLINQVLDLIAGHTHDVVFKHDTNRVIQSCIKYGNNEQRSKLFDQFKGNLDELLKSRYAKFFVKKMLKYGSKKQRELIIKCFHGKVRKMIRHKDASDIMETIYSEYATASQKIALVQEFYGADFALFKSENSCLLEKILEAEPHRKSSIIKYMKEALTPLIDRSVITHSIVHKVLLEFFTHADEKSRTEMIEAIRECVVHILHTHDGARVAMHCLWFGTAKDRKIIVKSFKKYVTKICKEEYGHLVMLSLFDVIDDTVLVKKVIFPEIISSLKELALDSYGRKVLLYLLCPRVAYYFHPSVTNLLKIGDGNPTSKKAPEVRRRELLEAISADLLQLVVDECEEFLVDKGACQLVQAILMRCPGDVTPAMNEIINLANKGLDPFSPDEDHLIKSAVGHFTLKRLIQQDKERMQSDKTDEAIYFSKLLVENQDPGTLFEWCKVNRGAFVVASLLESPVPGISEQVKGQLISHASKLKKYKNAGVNVVLKLLES